MNGKKIRIFFLALLCCLLLTGVVLANGEPAVEWWVIGGGGGQIGEEGLTTLNGTIAQAVVGTASLDPYELCSGFWCVYQTSLLARSHRIHLPLISRD